MEIDFCHDSSPFTAQLEDLLDELEYDQEAEGLVEFSVTITASSHSCQQVTILQQSVQDVASHFL